MYNEFELSSREDEELLKTIEQFGGHFNGGFDGTFTTQVNHLPVPEEVINEDERKKRAHLEGKELWQVARALGPKYNYKKFQKEWFPEGTNFSNNIDSFNNIKGLVPNLIIKHYLVRLGWKTENQTPYVTHTFINDHLVIFSTFQGKIEAEDIAVITAYNYIKVKGLEEQVKGHFHLIKTEEDYNQSIQTKSIIGSKIIEYGFKPAEQEETKNLEHYKKYLDIKEELGYPFTYEEFLTSPVFSLITQPKEKTDLETVKVPISPTFESFSELTDRVYGFQDIYKEYKAYKFHEKTTNASIDRLKETRPRSLSTEQEQDWLTANSIRLEKDLLDTLSSSKIKLEQKLVPIGYKSIEEFEALVLEIQDKYKRSAIKLVDYLLNLYLINLKQTKEYFSKRENFSALYEQINTQNTAVKNMRNAPAEHYKYMNEREKNHVIEYRRGQVYDDLSRQHTVFGENNRREVQLQFDEIKSSSELEQMLQHYFSEREQNVYQLKNLLHKNPEKIYGLNELMSYSFDALSITSGTMTHEVIKDAQASYKLTDTINSTLLAILSISVGLAATVATMGGASPVVLATLAGAGLTVSMYDLQITLDKYEEEAAAYNLGLSTKEPSVVWILLAITGAGLDVAPLLKSIKLIKPAVDALDASGDLAKFSNTIGKLNGIDQNLARILKAKAAASKNYHSAVKLFGDLVSTTAQGTKGFSPKVFDALTTMAYHKFREGVLTFQQFLNIVRRVYLTRGISKVFTPEELESIKRAWLQGSKGLSKASETLLEFEMHGIKAARVLEGSNEKVAIIGRTMGDLKKPDRLAPGVVDYARKLREMGYQTELFAGRRLSQQARKELKSLYDELGRELIPKEVRKTLAYKENIKWANKMKKEGFTVIDIGNPNKLDAYSAFYAGEKHVIFGDAL